jgi:DNA (cytosine-5)-methyltransferase 1
VNHASLFSGIGGFDLAAEWMGWTNVFNCEWEEFPQRVLKHHFPNAKQYGDIKELDATAYAGRIDILTGGFPCQPYSLAGKRKGKDDERHLWPEMLRVIRECTPRWVVGENVRGLVGWNGGLVFEEVCADLEAQGYTVQPFLLPAAGVGAPHRRDRIWFVAYTDNAGRNNGHGQICTENAEIRQWDNGAKPCNPGADNAANTNCAPTKNTVPTGWHLSSCPPNQKQDVWKKFPAFSPVCRGNDGLSQRLDGITFPKWRRESIKAYGNAIVPQVALQIFKAINEYENGT